MHWQSSSPPPWAPSYPLSPRIEARLQRWRVRPLRGRKKKDRYQGERSLEQWTQLNGKTWRKRTTVLLLNPPWLSPSAHFHNTERDSRSSAVRETLFPFQELGPDEESLFFLLNRRKRNRRWRVYLLHTWEIPRKTESFQPGISLTGHVPLKEGQYHSAGRLRRAIALHTRTGGSNPGCQVTDVGMERSDSWVDLGLIFCHSSVTR